MKNYLYRIFSSFFLLFFSFTLEVGALTAPPSSSSVRLTGYVPNIAKQHAIVLKHLDTNQTIPITFTLPLRHQGELEELVHRIYDPNDEMYGKYLTSEEFVERFAPTQENYSKVMAYAKKLGFKIAQTHPNRTLLNVTGNLATVEKAFDVRLNLYWALDGRKFYAPTNDPQVDSSIAPLISGIVGLDNSAVWRPLYQRQERAGGGPELSGPQGGFSPNDIAKAYNLTSVSEKGSGQVIALFELADYLDSDITAYTDYFGLPTPNLRRILVDGGSQSGANLEVTLDIQLALALAPQSQIYVYEGPNSNQGVLDTYNRIATDNIAKQISTSWGIGENLENLAYLQAENAIFLQMAAHGQTIYAAAGDNGAFDDYPDNNSLAVDDPASQPYVVGVGGTRLTVDSATGHYKSESVWNNGPGNGAGGGGVSVVWPIPSWQAGVSTVYSKINRNVPDVALNADPDTGYSVFYQGDWTICGGTSCAAPLWAAFTACVNQQRAATQKATLGFANPILYSIAVGSSYATNFFDITIGNNQYYSAQPGYDNASGCGSFNGANLFDTLTNSAPSSIQTPRLKMTITDNGPFNKKKTGTYHINVANQGLGATSGDISLGITLPPGLTFKSFTGSGWRYNARTSTFTRSDILPAGESFQPIIMNVNVNKIVKPSVTLKAVISGGGSASSTVTDTTSVR